ncbi:MAG: hypothetical protein AAFN93_02475, partial [Bacteroidota bacterium]
MGIRLREKYVRWVGILVLAFIMAFLLGPGPGESFIHKYLRALLFTAVFWNGAFIMFIYFRKRYPEIRQTPKRLLITMICLTIFLVVGDNLICLIIEQKSWAELSDPSIV